MNYSQMSDVDIAVLVGGHVSKDGQSLVGINGRACIHEYAPSIGNFGEICLGWKEFDPCNSWADAGPIIVSNLIALKPVSLFVGGHRWFATKGEGDFSLKSADDNPLRAAMILFLMMVEDK